MLHEHTMKPSVLPHPWFQTKNLFALNLFKNTRTCYANYNILQRDEAKFTKHIRGTKVEIAL